MGGYTIIILMVGNSEIVIIIKRTEQRILLMNRFKQHSRMKDIVIKQKTNKKDTIEIKLQKKKCT